MGQIVLQEYMDFDFNPEIIESKEDGKQSVIRLKGLFQKGEVPNGNKRVYPTPILEREVKRLSNYISERRMIGELDHPPGEIKPRLGFASHIVTFLEMRGSDMYGQIEILSTDSGKNLRALYESGVRLGVSSRGTGGLRQLPNGLSEVEESYSLNTFDIVNEPSVTTAFISESLQQNNSEVNNVLYTLKRKTYFIFKEGINGKHRRNN